MIESAVSETPQTVGSHYDDLDYFYRDIWGLHVHHGYWKSGKESAEEATLELIQHVLRDTSLGADMSIIDVGCGYGETARYLARTYGAAVTGYTVSKAQFAIAEKLIDRETKSLLDFKLQDWNQNDYPTAAADLVLSIESSEHMPDIRVFFEQAYRVLKPGGKLKVCAWLSSENPTPWQRKHLLELICTEGRLRLCTASEYSKYISEAGFSTQNFEEITSNVKRTWTHCIKRVSIRLLSDIKYAGFLLKNSSRNKDFLKSLLRIRFAYERGAMRYGVFTAIK